jgi:hypothetical protein
VAPELAYVMARYAALAPFSKVADLLSELLPVSGAANAGTVRNRTSNSHYDSCSQFLNPGSVHRALKLLH